MALAAVIGGALFLAVSSLIAGAFIALGKPVVGLFVFLVWLAFVAAVCIHFFVYPHF